MLGPRTTRPIRRLTKAAQEAAGGDLTVRVEPEGSIELVDARRVVQRDGRAPRSASSSRSDRRGRGEFGGGGVVGVVGGVGGDDDRAERRGDRGVGDHRGAGPGVGGDRGHGRRGGRARPRRPGTTSNRPRPTSRCPANGRWRWPAGQRDRRDARPDQRDRRPDEPAGAQRGDRGGAGRRGRPRVRGGGRGGASAGRAVEDLGRRDRHDHPRRACRDQRHGDGDGEGRQADAARPDAAGSGSPTPPPRCG